MSSLIACGERFPPLGIPPSGSRALVGTLPVTRADHFVTLLLEDHGDQTQDGRIVIGHQNFSFVIVQSIYFSRSPVNSHDPREGRPCHLSCFQRSAALAGFQRKLGCQFDGFNHARMFGNPLPGDVKGGAVID